MIRPISNDITFAPSYLPVTPYHETPPTHPFLLPLTIEKFSTDLALIELSDKIAEAMDNKKHMMGIFIDLSKAFDTLNHSISLQKLSNYGIRGVANDWFKNYLTSREQYVIYNNILSSRCTITTGVTTRFNIRSVIIFIVHK